jgi:hypothetical protein
VPAPKDYDALWREVRDGLAQLRRFMRNPFANTSLSAPEPGVLNVDGILQGSGFDGDLATDNVGTTGWAMSADKVALPEVLLRPGSIGNDILANPVVPGIARLSASGFSLTTSYVNKDSVSLTVPDGCTRLLVALSGHLYVVNQNTTGGADGTGTEAIYIRLSIGTQNSTSTPTGVSGNFGFATSNGGDAFILTGLTPGDTLTFAVAGKCGYVSIPAYVDNYIVATASLTWLR